MFPVLSKVPLAGGKFMVEISLLEHFSITFASEQQLFLYFPFNDMSKWYFLNLIYSKNKNIFSKLYYSYLP